MMMKMYNGFIISPVIWGCQCFFMAVSRHEDMAAHEKNGAVFPRRFRFEAGIGPLLVQQGCNVAE